MEVSGYDGNKVLWVVLYDHVFEDPRKNDETGVQRFGFDYFDVYKGGGGSIREGGGNLCHPCPLNITLSDDIFHCGNPLIPQ